MSKQKKPDDTPYFLIAVLTVFAFIGFVSSCNYIHDYISKINRTADRVEVLESRVKSLDNSIEVYYSSGGNTWVQKRLPTD